MFRRIATAVTLGVTTCAVLGLIDGCLDRPVEHSDPVTKTNFIAQIPQGSIDKVDLLFDIDNSASMGDKQAYLAQAVPDLITRLVQPNCVKSDGTITGQASLGGDCTDSTSTAEFPPVHNLHIGIVSSSLGMRLGNACDPTATQMLAGGGTISRHNDDQAHLLNRTADPTNLTNYDESNLADAPDPDDFLNWFPSPMVNSANITSMESGPTPVTDPTVLNTDFEKLVVGVHQFGCGIESQLESWYRFLIQPDPYASLATDKNGLAQWVGVDTTILQQRADFLRPDSLVAILVLTDENDSEVDVRSFGGSAWNFMSTNFNPPRGTAACATTPGSTACNSCQFQPGDSNCKQGPYTSATDWGYDLNLRHVHEKVKYGVDVQFPIQRYVLGLTSAKVPNRSSEYPSGATSYAGAQAGNLTCTNPLFAASLPRPPSTGTWNPSADDLCNLPAGTRSIKNIFYAHIGGVPHQLLQTNPADPNSPQKPALTDADWQLILGKDPLNYDYTGIDPHMIESYQQRTSATVPNGGFPVADQSMPEGSDPVAGREWTTDSTNPEHQGLLVDREYACIFKLTDTTGKATPRQCDNGATTADPTLLDSCDCQPPLTGTFTHAQVPAVCNDATPSQQDSAKTYPTIRELLLARLLGQVTGANEGIISSLCPIHTFDTSGNGTDALYGYRPAMNAIISKLSQALSHTCLPQQLAITGSDAGNGGQVACLVLATFPPGPNAPTKCEDIDMGNGFTTPDSTVLTEFHNDQHAQFIMGNNPPGAIDPSTELTCTLNQLPANIDCSAGQANGWCYLDSGVTIGACSQAIIFNKSALTAGVVTSLQCLEASTNVLGDGGVAPAPATTSTTPAPAPVSDAGGASD